MLFGVEQSTYDKWSPVVIWVATAAVLAAVGFYILGKIRGAFRQSERESGILLDNFRELHSRGELSDEEYRTIKSKLASQLREQWKTDDVRRGEGAGQGKRGG
jgi:uncharacterized membrane protein